MDTFSSLKAGQKKVVALLGIGAVITAIGIAGYVSSSKNQNQGQPAAIKTKNDVVNMDNQLMAQSELLNARKDVQVAQEALEAEKKKQEDLAKAAAAGLVPPGMVPSQTSDTKISTKLPPPIPKPSRDMPSMPPPAHVSPGVPPPPPRGGNPGMAAEAVSELEIGGISLVSNTQKPADAKDDKKKDENKSVFLPISYMEATLLSGLDAPTTSAAKGNPVPVLIRVKTPAVLPNEVKANLRGCFVVADGKGNLGTERAELVLVSLSCIDRKGQAVIDQSLVGYVVDADGKAGLRGRVVTKMGALITRSMIAGMFGGFGDALKSSSTTSSVSALGNLQTIDPKDIGMAGLGNGLSNAFGEIQKFYLEMANSTMPVIEIGAARPLTLVVTKGTNLEIKKMSKGVVR
jgi:conjugal transfer pilus assembly protein TraB